MLQELLDELQELQNIAQDEEALRIKMSTIRLVVMGIGKARDMNSEEKIERIKEILK